MKTTSPGTLQAVAQALNLSPGTVSRALSGRGDIAPKTRLQVSEVAAELNYVPRRSQKRTDAFGRIGVCLGNLCVSSDGTLDPSYVGVHYLTELERAASDARIGVMVGFADALASDQHIERLPMLQPRETQGIILVYPFPEDVVRQLAARSPVVSIEHVYPSASVDTIGPAHAVDAMSAVEYLYGLGHRRIAYVSDEDAKGARLTMGLRHAGYVSGLTRCGLDYRPDDVVNVFSTFVKKPELAAHVARWVRDGVTAVITSIDRHGYLLWDQLPTLGIKVPQDVSLVGIGGIYRARGLPQLTTWRCDFTGIASAALDALRSRYTKGRSNGLYQEMASVFVEGASTAAPGEAAKRASA